jgi:gliding motility-associated-like protein
MQPKATSMKTFPLCIFLVAISSIAEAQGFYNRGALISVAPQTVLSIPDSLVNTGTLINNGELRIAGSWLNQGTYQAGAGQINFDNNLPQVINHNHQSVGHLTISGGGEKRFLADITIETTLDLVDGVLISENNARIILLPNAVVTGGSNTSHVVGPITRRGPGDWLFPGGNGTTYLPFMVRDVPGTLSAATVMLHELANGESLITGPELEAISSTRYWELAWETGDPGDAKVVLPLHGEQDLTTNTALAVVAGSTSPTGTFGSLGQSEFAGSFSSGRLASSDPLRQFLAAGALVGDRSIFVYNGISPNDDGANDFMRIRNIEFYPDCEVMVLNRWGDQIFKTTGYNNDQNNFRGISKSGARLNAGTYYYVIDLKDDGPKINGYILIR